MLIALNSSNLVGSHSISRAEPMPLQMHALVIWQTPWHADGRHDSIWSLATGMAYSMVCKVVRGWDGLPPSLFCWPLPIVVSPIRGGHRDSNARGRRVSSTGSRHASSSQCLQRTPTWPTAMRLPWLRWWMLRGSAR